MKPKLHPLFLVLVLLCANPACAYMVGPALTLEKLQEQADLIFKGTAVSSRPIQDPWFKSHPGFAAQETQFKVVTVIKGENPGQTVLFRHYDEARNQRAYMFQPQFYHFEPGETYLVFASKSQTADDSYRQLWENQKSKADQGVLRCPDNKPVVGKSVKEIFWAELTTMLKSPNSTNIVYAIRELQQMSATNDSFNSTKDFDEKDVLKTIHSLAWHSDANVARAAISVMGCNNPYLSDQWAPFWLATVGTGQITGMGKMNPAMRNLGAEMYGSELAAIANSDRPPEIRALAIRALGLVRQPELRKQVETWVTDPAPDVRASATLLLADFPGGESTNQLIRVAGDPVAQVRSSVALSIGYGKQAQLAALLDKLLTDFDATVRRAAAMSLLSFSPTNENIAAILRAHLDLKEFDPLFLNALAAANPETFLDKLATAIENKTNPSNWWGGEIPAFTSWKILFKYLQGKPTEAVRSGKFDGYFDALEKVGNYSSSEPRDIYAFYLQRGLTERAAKYRQRATSDASYDLDYYFKEVDKNPSLYTRQ